MIKLTWFELGLYTSDAYLTREDLPRREIWMGRYILLVAIAALTAELINLPLVALLVLLAMLAVAAAIVMLPSLLLLSRVSGDPFWIAVWYVLKFTGVCWLYWKLIFEKQVQRDVSGLGESEELDRFTHRGSDWVLLRISKPKSKMVIARVDPGQDIPVPSSATDLVDNGGEQSA